MAKPAGTDPLGQAEIAEVLGVKMGTVRIWIFRGIFPPPDYPAVNRMPAWRRSTILRWAARTGRLPERDADPDEVASDERQEVAR